jgi:hypothetical protein
MKLKRLFKKTNEGFIKIQYIREVNRFNKRVNNVIILWTNIKNHRFYLLPHIIMMKDLLSKKYSYKGYTLIDLYMYTFIKVMNKKRCRKLLRRL